MRVAIVRGLLTFAVAIGAPLVASAAPINIVPYGSLTGAGLVTFEDVTAEFATIYDGILHSGGVNFAERFVGQTLSVKPALSGTSTTVGHPSGRRICRLETPITNRVGSGPPDPVRHGSR